MKTNCKICSKLSVCIMSEITLNSVITYVVVCVCL